MTNQKQKTALVLSGGGALGAAHIGVVKILEKQGYEFDFYSGVSAGSIIIGLLAVGYSADEIWKRLLDLVFPERRIRFKPSQTCFRNSQLGCLIS